MIYAPSPTVAEPLYPERRGAEVFSAAHLQFLRGASAATDALDFQEGKFQLDWAMDPTINVGPESMTTNQFTRKGNLSFKASLVRELIDHSFRGIAEEEEELR